MAIISRLALLALCLALVAYAAPQDVTSAAKLDSMSLEELDDQLQVSLMLRPQPAQAQLRLTRHAARHVP